jgi:hypothetical protein
MLPTFDASPLVHMDTPGVFFDAAAAPGGNQRKRMIQLALKLTERTIASLKTLAASIKTGLTGNASFTTPAPTPTEIQTAIDAVTTQETVVQAAEDNVTTQREVLEQKVDGLRNVLRAVAANCQDKVKNDAEDVARAKLLSANLPLKSEGAPVDEIARPENFHISQGDHSGEVDGGCNKVKNAKMYRVRCGAAPAGPFTTMYEGTKSSFTIKNHPLGVCYMQMSAFGTNGGWSEWSDLASINVV